MRLLQNAIGAIKYLSTRQNNNAKNKAEVVGMKKKYDPRKCLDCNNHVPVYLNFYCPEHWKQYLNEKLETDYAKKIISEKD